MTVNLARALLIIVVVYAGAGVAQDSETLSRGPSDAPVKIVEFFDFQCPFCAKSVSGLDELLEKYPGQVQLVLKNSPLPIHPDAMLAHEAALIAAEQGKFQQMSALLFAHQDRLKRSDLIAYARQLGLDTAAFQRRLDSGNYRRAVEQDLSLAQALGVDGTPTFFVNGEKRVGAQSFAEWSQLMESLLHPEARSAGQSKQATPDSRDTTFDLSRSQALGKANALITLVEFSDFQCPYCARAVPIIKELTAEYPDKIKWVFKNYPLASHADAPLAHRAALAAGEQGKFWEMHDLIFAGQGAIKRDDLLAAARKLGLDMPQFTAGLTTSRFQQQMSADREEGERAGVTGTPTFFINGTALVGAAPLAAFEQAIDSQLRALGRSPAQDLGGSGPRLGPADAPVTLTWFSDLQSALAPKAMALVRELMDRYPGKIRVVFKNHPLEIHPEAMLLHEAAMAAAAQGKFWEMHDLIAGYQGKVSLDQLKTYAGRAGLDSGRFADEIQSGKYHTAIEEDLQEAKYRSVLGTPVFFLNHVRVDGLQQPKFLAEIIDSQLPAEVSTAAAK